MTPDGIVLCELNKSQLSFADHADIRTAVKIPRQEERLASYKVYRLSPRPFGSERVFSILVTKTLMALWHYVTPYWLSLLLCRPWSHDVNWNGCVFVVFPSSTDTYILFTILWKKTGNHIKLLNKVTQLKDF